MIQAELLPPQTILAGRSQLAAERASLAKTALANCHLCEHHCGVNRLVGERGPCHAGSSARFFSAQTEVADELQLVPTFAVALSGCDLRCDFCITGRDSWNARAGVGFEPEEMAARAVQALEQGTRTVILLGGEPTIHLPACLEFVAALPDWAKLVWKTNAHASAQARQLLDSMFDIWVADFKFGNEVCAERLARINRYVEVVQENLLWAGEHSHLIVRHLLMPGHIDCCWRPIATWLASRLPAVEVSLRFGFWPAWQSARHQELCRPTTDSENRRALAIAREFELQLIE